MVRLGAFMARTGGSAAAALLSRHECKYLVSARLLAQVRDYLRPFMRPDAYALARPDRRYQVTSLYLDSSDLALYAMTNGGEKNRFKLRLRWYRDAADAPVFVEIKKRVDQIVLKSRCRVEAQAAEDLVRSLPGLSRASAGATAAAVPDVADFLSRCRRARARPMLLVRYWREAYESSGPDPVRVTFDTELEYALAAVDALGRGDAQWRSTPLDGAILEIKFTQLVPSWVRSMIRDLELQKQSIPKYCLSIEEAMRRGEYRLAAASTLDRTSARSPRARAGWGT